MGAELILPNGTTKVLGEPEPEVVAPDLDVEDVPTELFADLVASGGLPFVKVVVDLDETLHVTGFGLTPEEVVGIFQQLGQVNPDHVREVNGTDELIEGEVA